MLDRLATPAFDTGRRDFSRGRDKETNPFDAWEEARAWNDWKAGWEFEERAERDALNGPDV